MWGDREDLVCLFLYSLEWLNYLCGWVVVEWSRKSYSEPAELNLLMEIYCNTCFIKKLGRQGEFKISSFCF